MIEILGIQVEVYFVLPVIIFMAVGAYRIIRPFILRANALKIRLRDKKRFAIVHEMGKVSKHSDEEKVKVKHVYVRSNQVVNDMQSLCGDFKFWFSASNESYSFDKITCNKCKNLVDTI